MAALHDWPLLILFRCYRLMRQILISLQFPADTILCSLYHPLNFFCSAFNERARIKSGITTSRSVWTRTRNLCLHQRGSQASTAGLESEDTSAAAVDPLTSSSKVVVCALITPEYVSLDSLLCLMWKLWRRPNKPTNNSSSWKCCFCFRRTLLLTGPNVGSDPTCMSIASWSKCIGCSLPLYESKIWCFLFPCLKGRGSLLIWSDGPTTFSIAWWCSESLVAR